MDRSVKFYENVLFWKVKHKENNTWTDFNIGNRAI